MKLVPFEKHIHTTNDLFTLVGAPTKCLVKLYRGEDRQARRDREFANISAWAQAGFKVPAIYDYDIDDPGDPYLIMQHLQGPNLCHAIRENRGNRELTLNWWSQTLETVYARHDLAINAGRADLIHTDSSTGNVILTDDGVFFIDFEAPIRFGDVSEGASVELAMLCRWAVRDAGIDACGWMMADVMRVYQDRDELLKLIVKRTLGRPMQIYHRWKDRKKKLKKPGEVTKYDIADALVIKGVRNLFRPGDIGKREAIKGS